MEKTFTIDGREYTFEAIKAVAMNIGEDESVVDAILVRDIEAEGDGVSEVTDWVEFNRRFPNDEEDAARIVDGDYFVPGYNNYYAVKDNIYYVGVAEDYFED